jgi:hypothetical protein
LTAGRVVGPSKTANMPFLELHIREISWIIAGIFVFGAVAISVHLIGQHLKHFSNPVVQRKIVGILWYSLFL